MAIEDQGKILLFYTWTIILYFQDKLILFLPGFEPDRTSRGQDRKGIIDQISQDLGQPIRIVDLARNLIRLSI